MTFAIGSLVNARGREWVVLPESSDELLMALKLDPVRLLIVEDVGIGKTLPVLFEGNRVGLRLGRCYRDAAEIDGMVIVEGEAAQSLALASVCSTWRWRGWLAPPGRGGVAVRPQKRGTREAAGPGEAANSGGSMRNRLRSRMRAARARVKPGRR